MQKFIDEAPAEAKNTLREATRLALDSFGVEYEIIDDKITLSLDVLSLVLLELLATHEVVHMVQARLRDLFPAIELSDSLRGVCDRFSERFPVNESLGNFLAEVERKRAAAVKRDFFDMLRVAFTPTPPPEEAN